MATPAERFRLVPVSKDRASITLDPTEEHRGQWVLRRVGSNGFMSLDNQIFPVGNAYRGELVDVFVDQTLIQVWSKNHLVKTVARDRSRPLPEGQSESRSGRCSRRSYRSPSPRRSTVFGAASVIGGPSTSSGVVA
jgi:hypothetical protein